MAAQPASAPARALLALALAALVSGATTSVNHRVAHLRQMRRAGQIAVSPSVAKCDLRALGAECRAAVEAGAPWLHFSVQDGRMVPKISFGAPVVAALRPDLPETVFDVKLGVVEPERRVADFVKAGADIISVHPEATLQLAAVVNAIKEAGCAPGVVLNPATPLSAVEHVLPDLDVVVIMLVSPGYGGPKHLDEAARKIGALRRMCADRGLDPWIEVDGGVSPSNARGLLNAGATALVAGGSVFKAPDKAAAIRELVNPPAA